MVRKEDALLRRKQRQREWMARMYREGKGGGVDPDVDPLARAALLQQVHPQPPPPPSNPTGPALRRPPLGAPLADRRPAGDMIGRSCRWVTDDRSAGRPAGLVLTTGGPADPPASPAPRRGIGRPSRRPVESSADRSSGAAFGRLKARRQPGGAHQHFIN